MQRQIKFRGKRIDNGEWAYGYYFESFTGIHYILALHDHILGMTEFYEVDPATVGQYTGIKDKNGIETCAGDIVRYGVNYERINKIVFEQGCFQLQGNGGLAPLRYHHLLDSNTLDVIAIGNIYDNPELLEGGKTDV